MLLVESSLVLFRCKSLDISIEEDGYLSAVVETEEYPGEKIPVWVGQDNHFTVDSLLYTGEL